MGPAVRTVPARPGWQQLRAYLAGCASALLAAPLAFGLAARLLEASRPELDMTDYVPAPPLVEFAYSTCLHVAYSPVLSWVGLLIAAPLGALALARGWGGWLVATALFALVGIVLLGGPSLVQALARRGVSALGEAFGAGASDAFLASAIVGAAFWIGARLAALGLFRRPPGASEVGA